MASPPGDSKHRDTQLQLQRKLQEREQHQREPPDNRPDQKRKLQEQEFHGVPQNLLMGKRSKVGDEDMYEGNMDYEETGEKNCDNQNRYSVVVPNNQNEHYVVNGALNSDNFETLPHDFTNYSGERLEIASPITMIANQTRPPSSISLDKLPRKKQALVEVAASLAAQSV